MEGILEEVPRADMPDNPPVPLESRRMPLETRVLLKFDRFSGFISEFSSNVSQGGMFIRTRTPEPVGTVLDFGFRLGDDYELIHGRGEVVWIRAQDQAPDRPAGMGIRFLELSAGSRELIRKMVENFVQAGGTPFDVAQAPPAGAAEARGAAPPPSAPEPPAAPQPALSLVPEEPAPRPAPEPAPPAELTDVSLALDDPGKMPWDLEPEVPWLAAVDEPPAPAHAEARDSGPLLDLPELDLADEDDAPGPAPAAEEPIDVLAGPDLPPAASAGPLAGALPDLGPEPALSQPEPRERTPLPWPAAAAGEPAPRPAPDSPFAPLPPPLSPPLAPPDRPTRAIDLPARPAPPVFQAAAAPSAERGRRRMLAGAVAAVLLLVAAALLFARGPLRGFLRLPGTAAAAPEVPPPPERPAAAEPVPPAPAPEILEGPATAAAEPDDEPAPAPAPTPAAPAPAAAAGGEGELAAAPPPAPPAPAAPAPAPAPAAVPFGAVERITWERAGGATDILLWLDGAVRRADYQQFRVGEPPREVVKLIGVRRPFPQARLDVGTPQVRQLRIGFHDKPGGDELHVVIDLADPGARITGIQEEAGRLRVRIQ